MTVRGIVAGNAGRRADLVDEDRLRVQLVEDAAGEGLHHLLPRRAGWAHHGERCGEASVLLHVARVVLPQDGVGFGEDEAARGGRPEASVHVGHRFLSHRLAVRDAFLRAGLGGKVFGVVHVVARMLPEVPVEAGGEVGEDRFGAREDVGRHVGIAVDVDPERNLAESAGVVGDVLDGAARGPLLLERVGAVAVCEAPPVARERREHHGVARPLGGLARHAGVFDRRLVAGVLLALHEEVLDAGFGVFGDEVESVRAKEEPRDHRAVAEVGAAEGTRLGAALREELRTVVV